MAESDREVIEEISLDRTGMVVATSLVMAKKRDLPKYCFTRGNKIWFCIKDEDGQWRNRPTPYTTDQVELAERFVRATLRGARARQECADAGEDVGTVAAYAEKWLKSREARGIASVDADRNRLKYALPHVGHLALEEVRPRHVRDMVRALRERTGDDRLAPRTILHVYNTLHNLLESAVVDELIMANPVKVHRGELPRKIDKDPEWRARATYTVREVERLISDPVIPVERRVQYALKAIAGMRHGEVAALCWRHIDYDAAPFPRLNISQSYSSTRRVVKSTKTEETRAVPVHPTLGKILEAWRYQHWERIYGRKPTDDDYVVPTRTMNPVNVADAVHAMKDDLDALGLRKEAGKHRHRGGHDLRSWYKTRLIEDDADSLIVRRTTHAPPKDVDGGYERFSWATICREVGKLKVEILDGKVLPLLTASLQAEKKAAARWTSVVTPLGLETMTPSTEIKHLDKSSTGSESATVFIRGHSRAVLVRNVRSGSVQSMLSTASRMLERAILRGDTARALNIARQLNLLGVDTSLDSSSD